ncbi:hypothetical protein ElyMa_006473100 [Elysia marginata]|uniref:Uncharacterized protein n=1 Tax=Elysia marginata TaxID=1093978 RepID=A0AAV4HZT7_9GAST|nr:hypothetical protein ElyMa_006473100 [Elysia marginata]
MVTFVYLTAAIVLYLQVTLRSVHLSAAFFQRRFRRLKKGIQGSSENVTSEPGKDLEKTERDRAESSPEPVVRNTQDAGPHDSASEQPTANASILSQPERERKPGHAVTETSSSPERAPARRETYDPYSTSRSSPPVTHHTSSSTATRHTPPATSPIKFPFHQIVSPTQDV